ncbi:ABC transporter ATP-binding protein, partial [Streptomyces caelestis]|uniref:ABC transporter ATP-binding protein n=1 Tax=Streptomyces caelestis TaxID=36816 RepID=UPI003648F3E7
AEAPPDHGPPQRQDRTDRTATEDQHPTEQPPEHPHEEEPTAEAPPDHGPPQRQDRTDRTATEDQHPTEQPPGRPRVEGTAAGGPSGDGPAGRGAPGGPSPERARKPSGPAGRRYAGAFAPAPGPPVLAARGLRVRYGGFTALDGVDLDVPAGRVAAVVGPNGAGKSTLFHCLAGTLRPARGSVSLGGRDVTRLPAHTRTRLGIARTFQQLAVFPTLTVAENVRVGAERGRLPDPGAVERTLRLFGLDGPMRARPAAGLPTGTLRRVELARALAAAPRVLLLDEPAAGLDGAEVTALARILGALAADGTALLVVEHDLDLVAGLADVVHVMAAGRIVASGPPGNVLDALGEATGP